ncbi:MAG: nucleotidyltransferase domain-containing protein [Elusimicrobia bacterium]|nr:nucleotidyltransferase domain-containing protein [Elusimicrobiota bacterium]
MIRITPKQLRTVRKILVRHVPNAEVRAFGSRVEGTPKDYSDLDLVIVAPTNPDSAELDELRDAFAQSDLPFRVDVLDWNVISDEFKKVIEGGYEVVQQARRGKGKEG